MKRDELSEPAAASTSLLPVVVAAPGEAVSATGEADAKEHSRHRMATIHRSHRGLSAIRRQ